MGSHATDTQHPGDAADGSPPTGPTEASDRRARRGGTRIRWPRWGWVPYLLLGVFVGYWAATHTGAVVSGATSWRAIVFGIGAGLLALALLVGIARLTKRGWAGQLAGLVPLIAAVVVAVLPSYLTTTVSEAAPEGLTAADTPSASDAPGGGGDSTSVPSSESSVPAPPPPTAPAGPIELSSAQFVGIDHDAAGTARLIQLEDGSLLVRFEQFSVEAGPDYDVYVVSGANVSGPADGTLIGDLKGTVGDQNYDIPAGAIPTGGEPVTVLIWCEIFAVPVANATL